MRIPLPGLFLSALCGLLLARCATDGQSGDGLRRPQFDEPIANAFSPFDGVIVEQGREIRVRATVCIEAGWLEQVACSPNSREHEALVVVDVRPSNIHAALLLAGFEPGMPGRWAYDGETLMLVPPQGEPLEVLVSYPGPDGALVELPIRAWIRDHLGAEQFPVQPWVFGGSLFASRPSIGEHYVADKSGSIVGLVTFGDEVVGFSDVLADQDDIRTAEWEANTDALPPIGTQVWLILRKWAPKT
jgi:hypothetical protein